MNPFQDRHPGNISVEVPLLGFGDVHLGELFEKVEEAQSSATLKTPYSSGIHYYDTGPWYRHGLSEHRIGGLLQGHPRNEFQLSTKFGTPN